ncbi:MAG TPA: TIGR03016 family PEP-CTERM system-associated outer membrane protein, partial [Thauera sp.]|uniref:TIGR03016 family PEP-CTERM system-associated outer membrane protein n=1 Tax=Thauera sp. TaxID=1905334 RepID=UPI002BE5B7CC
MNAQLTWTDNVDVADADPQQDWVLEVSPGVSMVRESGRLRGGLDLRLRSLNHVERTEENTTYLALNGRGSFEAIENSVFVDVDGSISRDNQSSFRGRLPGDALDYDEDNEVRVFSVAPRFVFPFGAAGQGQVSYRERWLDSGSSSEGSGGGSAGSSGLGDQQSRTLGVGLSDPAALRLFGWGLDYSRSETRYDERATRDVEQEVAR